MMVTQLAIVFCVWEREIYFSIFFCISSHNLQILKMAHYMIMVLCVCICKCMYMRERTDKGPCDITYVSAAPSGSPPFTAPSLLPGQQCVLGGCILEYVIMISISYQERKKNPFASQLLPPAKRELKGIRALHAYTMSPLPPNGADAVQTALVQ